MKRKKFSIDDLPDSNIINDNEQKFGLPDILIPAEVLFNPNLTPVQKFLFGLIRNLAKSEKGCWATNRYLAKILNVEKQTITNGIAKLKEQYYIILQFRRLSNGNTGRQIFIDDRHPQIYASYLREVYKNINNGILTRLNPPITNNIPPYNQDYRKLDNIISKLNDTSSEEEDLKKASNGYITPSDFDEFWKLYPSHRKGSKGQALTKWEVTCRSPHRPTMNRVRRALAKQKKSAQWLSENGKWIPLITTWINQKRWLDDPEQMKDWSKENDPNESERAQKRMNDNEFARNFGYEREV
jgi:hypothetical protein